MINAGAPRLVSLRTVLVTSVLQLGQFVCCVEKCKGYAEKDLSNYVCVCRVKQLHRSKTTAFF